jgi:hypothetical protein
VQKWKGWTTNSSKKKYFNRRSATLAPSSGSVGEPKHRPKNLKIDQKAFDYYRNMPKAIFVAIGDDIDDSWNSSD